MPKAPINSTTDDANITDWGAHASPWLAVASGEGGGCWRRPAPPSRTSQNQISSSRDATTHTRDACAPQSNIRVIRAIRGTRKRREDFSSRRLVFLGAGLSVGALLRAGRKVDEVAILQGDAVLVGGVLLQVGGGHVEYPEATAPAERTVRDIVVSSFIYVVNRAPHRVNQSYRAVAARKHRSRIGDRLAISAAHSELHWNSAADLPDAAAVSVDWRQNDASRVRPGAGAISNR